MYSGAPFTRRPPAARLRARGLPSKPKPRRQTPIRKPAELRKLPGPRTSEDIGPARLRGSGRERFPGQAPVALRPALEFGHFARQRRAGKSAQGQRGTSAALGKPMRNLNPPCKGGGSFSPKGNAHRMPSHSASTRLGVGPQERPAPLEGARAALGRFSQGVALG